MAKRNLLAEIEADVLGDKPLADTLRKCVVLGGQAGSTELREWATRELRGYDGVEIADVPEFRKVGAVIKADAVTGNSIVSGQQMDAWELPEVARDAGISNELPLRQGVGELEALRATAERDNGVKMSLPGALMLGRLMDQQSGNPFQHITALYWSLSSSAIAGVLDQIRTTLVELVAEMRAGVGDDEIPSADLADQAVHVAVHGDRARVTVTSAQAASGSTATAGEGSPPARGFWTIWRTVGAFVVGVATVAAAWFGWLNVNDDEPSNPPAVGETTTTSP